MSASLVYIPRARRRSMQWRQSLSSITWGTRSLSRLGILSPLDDGSMIFSPGVMPGSVITPQPFPGNPDTLPGAWPGLNPAVVASGAPQQVPMTPAPTANGTPQPPVVVTPTSGAIPPPQTVAAATAAPASWLEQELIAGIQNKWLLLGGIAAALAFGGKH